jgi:hypothetical protein
MKWVAFWLIGSLVFSLGFVVGSLMTIGAGGTDARPSGPGGRRAEAAGDASESLAGRPAAGFATAGVGTPSSRFPAAEISQVLERKDGAAGDRRR